MSIKRFISGLLAAVAMFASSVSVAQIDLSPVSCVGSGGADLMVRNIKVGGTYYDVPFRLNYSTYNFDINIWGITAGDGTSACSTTGSGCATLQVTVTNAFNGSVVSGATVTSGSVTATTNSSGVATLTNVTSGPASVTATASNFTSATQAASNLTCAQANTMAIALSPSTGTGAVPAGAFRAVLTWGENPKDVDAHLTGPTAAGGDSRFHVYFIAKTTDVASLDVDDVTSYGPETITVSPPSGASSLRAGVYRYSLHHYSGTSTIGASGANVRLTLPNGQVFNYTPAGLTFSGTNDVWTVFEVTVYSNGTMTVGTPNTIYSSSASSVRSHPAGSPEFGAEDLSLFHGIK